MTQFYTRSSGYVCIHKANKALRLRKVKTNTYKKLSSLSKTMGNAVKIDLIKGLTSFKKRVSAEALERAWATGNWGRVMATIPWDKLHDDLSPALKGVGQTAVHASAIQLLRLPPNINKNLRFDVTNPTIRNFITRRTGTLVVGIQADTQKLVQRAVMRSFTHASTPREVADMIKGTIGLDERLSNAYETFKEGFASRGEISGQNQALYLENKLEKLTDYRASMIAKTETRLATNTGQLSVWQEGAKQGYIDKATAKKEWVVDGDPCETCEPMDGKRVGLDDPWILKYPNGETKSVYVPTEAHPHCMCGMELIFDDETGGSNEED